MPRKASSFFTIRKVQKPILRFVFRYTGVQAELRKSVRRAENKPFARRHLHKRDVLSPFDRFFYARTHFSQFAYQQRGIPPNSPPSGATSDSLWQDPLRPVAGPGDI